MTDETPAACRTVTTQAELDAALADREQDPAVCIHVPGGIGTEASVLEWERANRPAPKPDGSW